MVILGALKRRFRANSDFFSVRLAWLLVFLRGLYPVVKRIDGKNFCAQAPSCTKRTAQVEHKNDEPANFLRRGIGIYKQKRAFPPCFKCLFLPMNTAHAKR
jgi:hypothetical protein